MHVYGGGTVQRGDVQGHSCAPLRDGPAPPP